MKATLILLALIPLAIWTGCNDYLTDPLGWKNFADQKQNYITDSPIHNPEVRMPVLVPQAPDNTVHNPLVRMPVIVPTSPDSPVHNPLVRMPVIVPPLPDSPVHNPSVKMPLIISPVVY